MRKGAGVSFSTSSFPILKCGGRGWAVQDFFHQQYPCLLRGSMFHDYLGRSCRCTYIYIYVLIYTYRLQTLPMLVSHNQYDMISVSAKYTFDFLHVSTGPVQGPCRARTGPVQGPLGKHTGPVLFMKGGGRHLCNT